MEYEARIKNTLTNNIVDVVNDEQSKLECDSSKSIINDNGKNFQNPESKIEHKPLQLAKAEITSSEQTSKPSLNNMLIVDGIPYDKEKHVNISKSKIEINLSGTCLISVEDKSDGNLFKALAYFLKSNEINNHNDVLEFLKKKAKELIKSSAPLPDGLKIALRGTRCTLPQLNGQYSSNIISYDLNDDESSKKILEWYISKGRLINLGWGELIDVCLAAMTFEKNIIVVSDVYSSGNIKVVAGFDSHGNTIDEQKAKKDKIVLYNGHYVWKILKNV